MRHDFSNEAYCDALRRLFHPGNGKAPPVLAGRGFEQDVMTDFLGAVLAKDSTDSDIVLYGPRGNGKTVLLRQFEVECRAAGVGVIALNGSQVPTAGKLAKRLLGPETGVLLPGKDDEATAGKEASVTGVIDKNLTKLLGQLEQVIDAQQLDVAGVSAGAPGLASLDLRKKTADDLDLALEGLLTARCYDKPLVVTLDEAHKLDINIGWRLLNLSQQLRSAEGAPFLLVLAGTPNLRVHLGEMDASFWGRSKKLALGRLDAAATRDALVGPLQAKGIGFDEDALDRVAADSQHYPYFIQLWGKALCEVLVNTKQGKQITEAVVDAAFPVVEAAREDYYQDRHKELVKQKLLPAAGALASAFAGQSVVHEEILFQALSRELGLDEEAGQDCLEQLSDLGYIWCPSPNDDYEPGIPSLMTHVQQRLQIRAEVKARTRPPAPDDDARPDAEDRNDDGGNPGSP